MTGLPWRAQSEADVAPGPCMLKDDSTWRPAAVIFDAAAAPARTELPSGPRRRWQSGQAVPRGDARSYSSSRSIAWAARRGQCRQEEASND